MEANPCESLDVGLLAVEAGQAASPSLDVIQCVGFMALVLTWTGLFVAASARRPSLAPRVLLAAALIAVAAATFSAKHWPASIVLVTLALRELVPVVAALGRRSPLARRMFGRASWQVDPSRRERLFGASGSHPYRPADAYRRGRFASDDGDADFASTN